MSESAVISENRKADNFQEEINDIKSQIKIVNSGNRIELKKLIKELNIDYIDEDWTKSEWMITYIAGITGIITDILTNQTRMLKPLDNKICEILKSKNVNTLKDILDAISKIFRNGESAPIDFQDFEMFGPKSIHEIYSFGHDPLRFIEGIIQFITGNYRGVDKNGEIIKQVFGGPSPNIAHAIISYVAHMLSDFLNITSLPYPGSTFLMEFGSKKVRDAVTAAYKSKLYNNRIFSYQNITVLIISIIIHSYAVYDYWVQTKKINFLIGNNAKYQPMLLIANAMVMTENIAVTTIRGTVFKDRHAFFKIDWPIIYNTIKHSIKYIRNEGKEIENIRILTDFLLNKLAIEKKEIIFIDRVKTSIKNIKEKHMGKEKGIAGLIIVGAASTAAVSITINIIQGIRNKKLRKLEKDRILIMEKITEKVYELEKMSEANHDNIRGILETDEQLKRMNAELKTKDEEINKLKLKIDEQVTAGKVAAAIINETLPSDLKQEKT
jgi:hypothetical protein